MATKAEQIWDEINGLVEGGMTKADAFKELAKQYNQPVDSLRGSYYTHKRKLEGGEQSARPARTRRRETTPDDAVADARAALERAIASIDREIEVAKARADEAKSEHDALKASAEERKKAITERLGALK